MSPFHRSRRTAVAVTLTAFTTLVGGSIALPLTASATGGPAPESSLGAHDDKLLAEATTAGEKTVTLLVATKGGAQATAVRQLQGIGGVVRKDDADLGYLRVDVPIGNAKRAAGLSAVQAVDLDEVIPLEDPTPDGSQPPTRGAAPSAATARVNPYMPINETGAAAFTAANPTYDGRGTTIAIIDSGIDLAHPALKTTTTGEPKITDWVTATDSAFGPEGNLDDDPTWVQMATRVEAVGGTFTVDGQTYRAADGRYRFGIFDESDPRFGGELGNDLNRDGNPAGAQRTFALLWDTRGDTVQLDRDQDEDLGEEPALGSFSKTRQSSVVGKDNPATDVREEMPYVIQTDGVGRAINLGVVSGAHGSHVAGITAANGMFGGQMSGAAPGAKLMSVRVCLFVDGCTSHALLEGMTYAAKNDADVINMSIGGLPALNDGNNARAVLYDRLIDKYKVQMFISAGNSGSGMNTVGDPSVASKVLSVGSSISDDTWRANYGSDSAFDQNLHGFSSRGPREDGGFKPEIVAPGSAVSTTPTWQSGQPVAGTYPLPPGYGMFNGTSMASPQAAGVGALLVSAAKQTGVQDSPAQIRQSLTSSAQFLPRYQAYEQGNGLINATAAWNLLRKKVRPVDITSSVEVSTALSDFLAVKDQGVGIYDREDVPTGAYTRTYTFTRTSGGGGTTSYHLSWTGNDGTFSSPTRIALPLRTPVTLAVTINPGAAGAHSAILNLDDPSTPGIEKQTLNTVVRAEAFTAANGYTVARADRIGRNQTASSFFAVPAGTPAFKVDLAGGGAAPGAGQIRFLRFHPYGVGFDSNASTSCYTPSAGSCGGNASSRTVQNPQAGVWEVTVEARRTSDAAEAPYTLTASVLGASVSPNPDVIATASAGVPIARSYTLTNTFGPFTGNARGTGLGSARQDRPSVANGASLVREVQVTAGTTSLRATIGRTTDPAADLDLSVFRCAPTCVLVGQAADGDSEESVTVANPAPALYRVVVDGYAVPAGTTDFDYVDVFTNPTFGAVSVTDRAAARPGGASWTVPASVTAGTAPAAGRVLLGEVQVVTSGVLIGSGAVIVQAVTG
jgi:subtilisin family serine protease